MKRIGLINGLSNKEYHSGPEVSNTAISYACRSMKHYQHYKKYGSDISTKVALDGNIVHCAILEPDKLDKRYVVAPTCDKRTKAGKAQWLEFQEANKGLEVVTADQMEMAQRAQENVYGDAYLRDILMPEFGEPEVSIFWYDEESGLDCRCRPDWLMPGFVLDVKTTDNAQMFPTSVSKYGYHRQNAFYTQGALAGAGIEVKQFIFLVVEKKPPYDFIIYELANEYVEVGAIQCNQALSRIAECELSGSWPGYGNDIKTLCAPTWLLNETI